MRTAILMLAATSTVLARQRLTRMQDLIKNANSHLPEAQSIIQELKPLAEKYEQQVEQAHEKVEKNYHQARTDFYGQN